MSISSWNLWEIYESFENRIQRPSFVAGRGGHDVGDSSAYSNLGLELEVEGDEGKIIVWSCDLWCRIRKSLERVRLRLGESGLQQHITSNSAWLEQNISNYRQIHSRRLLVQSSLSRAECDNPR